MAFAVWQTTITDNQGNVVPGASVEVRDESDNTLATIYTDRAGTTPASNPITADSEGFVRFFAAGGAYKITATGTGVSKTLRYVAIGTMAESDNGAGTGMEPMLFVASDATLTASANLANVNGVPVARLDGATDERCNWIGRLPEEYGGGSFRLTAYWSSGNTTGDVDFDFRIGKAFPVGESPDWTDGGTVVSSDGNTIAATDTVYEATVTITAAEADGLEAGDFFQINLIRDADQDTSTNNVDVYGLLLEEIS